MQMRCKYIPIRDTGRRNWGKRDGFQQWVCYNPNRRHQKLISVSEEEVGPQRMLRVEVESEQVKHCFPSGGR